MGRRQYARVAGGALEALAVGERAAGELHRLTVRENRDRVLGGDQEVIRRALVLARGLEQVGESGGDLAGAITVRPEQSFGHRRAHLDALARPQRAVDGILVEDVDEAVALAQRSVRQLGLVEDADESMHAPEAVEPFLDVADIGAERGGNRRRVEVVPLHRRAGEELAVSGVDAIDLVLDHAADRLRQLAFDRGHRAGQPEAIPMALDHGAIAKVAEQLGQEERVALGARVQERGEEGWELVAGEERVDVGGDRRLVQQADGDLATEPAALELALNVQERVFAEQEVGGPIGADHQQPHGVDAAADVAEQVHGRDVGPVEVITEQGKRAASRELLQKGEELALEALLRGDLGVAHHLRERGVGGRGNRGDLDVPGGRGLFHQRQRVVATLTAQQALERFEDGQVGLGAGETLGAAPARHVAGHAAGDLGEEVFGDGGLADAGLAGQAYHQPGAAGTSGPGAA